MNKTFVLDASAFIYGSFPEGDLVTVPSVYAEVKDDRSRLRLELMDLLQVISPDEQFRRQIDDAAAATGDDKRLSPADRELLALALQESTSRTEVVLLTDDYAVQNVARKVGVKIRPLRQKKSRHSIEWEKRCTGCNRAYEDGDVCEVCGSPLRLKKRSITRGK